MNLNSAKILVSLPEGKEMLEYFAIEAAKLNRLNDLPDGSPEEVALKAKAGQRAFQTLSKILIPFLDIQEKPTHVRNEEFVV